MSPCGGRPSRRSGREGTARCSPAGSGSPRGPAGVRRCRSRGHGARRSRSRSRPGVVHRPLQAVGGVAHFRLDHVEQRIEVEALGLLRDALGGERPAGARDHRVRVGRPGHPQLLGVQALLDHVADEPVLHLRRAGLAQHRVQLVPSESLRTADQGGRQPRRRVARRPEPAGEVLLRLQPLRQRAQLAEVHAVVVAVPRVHLAHPRVLRGGQLGRHRGHVRVGRRRPGHFGLPSLASARSRRSPSAGGGTGAACPRRPPRTPGSRRGG